MEMARGMVQGADVWLNTPRRALRVKRRLQDVLPLTGGINLSVLDGWWAEGYRGDNR